MRRTPRLIWLVPLMLVGWGTPSQAQTPIPLRAYYADDFILETEDGSFQLRIRGNIHLDSRFFQAENRGAVQDIDIRRVRIDLQGRIHERFTFRVQPELAATPHIRNAWVNWASGPALNLRLGQFKVPFSSEWLTLDNNVNFVETGISEPIHPSFDRGVTLWGELLDRTLVYSVGAFTGVGIEADVGTGDLDDHKDFTARLRFQPFRNSGRPGLEGIHLVAQGTRGLMSVPTSRFETRGLRSANFGSALWRWRTEQVLGTDGRATDRVAAEIGARTRWGVEAHYLRGPFVLSTEYLEVFYRDVALYHDFYVGATRIAHHPLHEASGGVRSWSTWASLYLTGESKRLGEDGWRTARPLTSWGEGGKGAWELLARYTRTLSSRGLFAPVRVSGFGPGAEGLPLGYSGSTPGAGNSLTAAVLEGAHDVHEVSLGLNWTVNPMVRIQLNDVLLWAPRGDRTGDGANDNLLISGAYTGQSDPALRNRKTRWENAVMLRFIFKL